MNDASDTEHMEIDHLRVHFDTPLKGKFKIYPIGRFFSKRGCGYIIPIFHVHVEIRCIHL